MSRGEAKASIEVLKPCKTSLAILAGALSTLENLTTDPQEEARLSQLKTYAQVLHQEVERIIKKLE